jgi:hypothetical protein
MNRSRNIAPTGVRIPDLPTHKELKLQKKIDWLGYVIEIFQRNLSNKIFQFSQKIDEIVKYHG